LGNLVDLLMGMRWFVVVEIDRLRGDLILGRNCVVDIDWLFDLLDWLFDLLDWLLGRLLDILRLILVGICVVDFWLVWIEVG
jgi:hypothetical protein